MVNDTKTDLEKEDVYETVRGAVAGDDVPMEDEHENATFALVAATYPVALVLLLLVGLVVAYFTTRPTAEATGRSVPAAVPVE